MSFSGVEKAAIFLSYVGEEAASEILKGIDINDVGKISMHMTRLKGIKNSDIEDIYKEITEKISKGKIQVGGKEYLKNVLTKGLGEDNAKMIIEQASKESTIDSLKRVDTKTLSNFLITEHPQTIALILCLLEPVKAADVISSLPESLQGDVSTRIATIESIPTDAIEEIEDVLKKNIDVSKSKGRKIGGSKAIAEILNQSERSKEQFILGEIEKHDNNLAESIRQLMFIFDDIIKIDDTGIQMILKEISTEDLSLALKTASEGLKEKIFKNMSQRAAQMLKEDMESRGPSKVSDVEKAQQNIVRVAKKLEEEGKIVIAGGAGEEVVV